MDKLKVKVGLNKKKAVSSTFHGNKLSDNNKSTTNKKGHSDNDMGTINENGKHSDNDKSTTKKGKHSDNVNVNGNKHSDNVNENGNKHSDNESDSNSNVEYIGQGVLAGRENNSESELVADTQKRSHPDSDSVGSVDSIPFATPAVPPPRPSKKKPAIVVSPGAARPAVVDRDRSRSRSPKRSSPAGRPGTHSLPPSVPKPPRSSGSRSSKGR